MRERGRIPKTRGAARHERVYSERNLRAEGEKKVGIYIGSSRGEYISFYSFEATRERAALVAPPELRFSPFATLMCLHGKMRI